MNERAERAAVWWRALRYHFVPPSIFPAALGGAISWAVDHTFFPWYFLLVMLGIVINHLGVNMTDDYFDYKHLVDNLKPGEKNPYTGGSGVLRGGLIEPVSMFKALAFCYCITAFIGAYLALQRGLPILIFGCFGMFSSIFYTAPPVRFSHHGLGELGLLINFGTIIGLGSYFVQAQKLTLEAFFATLPMGIMLFSMIVINEIPDIEEDRNAGKLTLVARYGKKCGVRLYIISWFVTYSVIVGAVALKIMPVVTLLALLSLPIVYRSVKTLRINYENPALLAPANLDMIKAHSVTSLGLVAAYSLYGLMNGSNPFQLIFILLLLAASYAPAGIMLMRSGEKRRG